MRRVTRVSVHTLLLLVHDYTPAGISRTLPEEVLHGAVELIPMREPKIECFLACLMAVPPSNEHYFHRFTSLHALGTKKPEPRPGSALYCTQVTYGRDFFAPPAGCRTRIEWLSPNCQRHLLLLVSGSSITSSLSFSQPSETII